MDKLGVHVFEVGENKKLFEAGVVAHIAVLAEIGVPPFAGGLAEEGDIEEVGLFGVCESGLFCGNFLRDEMRLDRVGVDAVVDLGQHAVEVPGKGKAAIFVLFETLEFLDEVKLEFH